MEYVLFISAPLLISSFSFSSSSSGILFLGRVCLIMFLKKEVEGDCWQ
jgi:hypothetical protein